MGKILCATRGGKKSFRTQDAAIALARGSGNKLAFLFVVDICFLKRSRRAVRPDVVAAEMAKMGRFLLHMAQERAQQQGVAASVILRHGHLRQALQAAAEEYKANLLVLGKPGDDDSLYDLRDLETLAADTAAETGIRVIIL